MKTAEDRGQLIGRGQMGYFVRPMRTEDIPQVGTVERECFPTGWTPTPFQRELQSKTAAYLVACKASNPSLAREEASALPRTPATSQAPRSILGRFVTGFKGLLTQDGVSPPHASHHITGYVGLWFIVDEAHITAIGVRAVDRRFGIGELLLLASIEIAMSHGSRVVTLETRVSNHPAQQLYLKYGFDEAGVRKGYYVDNREDALIMTTDNLASPRYRERFQRLAGEHARRWGSSVRLLRQ